MPNNVASAESSPFPAPLRPYGWVWMQVALVVSGLVGLAAGLWKTTWFAEEIEERRTEVAEVQKWWDVKSRFKEGWRDPMKWSNVAQLTLAASMLIGATLMNVRFSGLRTSMTLVGWFGIVYSLTGAMLSVWYTWSWSLWAMEMPPAAVGIPGFEVSAAIGWTLAIALAFLALGKLLLFTIVVGYFGRFDVRAYLEDPPEWFASSVRPGVAK